MSTNIQFVDNPYLFPNICFRCRAGSEARNLYVDTGMDTEYDGRIYLCEPCFSDICTKSDGLFFTKDQVDLLLSVQQDQLYVARKITERQEILVQLLNECGINADFFLEKVENHERNSGRSTGSFDLEPSVGQTIPTGVSDSVDESERPSSNADDAIDSNPLLAGVTLKFD